MAIKLEVYLKRREMSLEEWMRENGVTKASELVPRCDFLGLEALRSDVAQAEQIFKRHAKEREDAEKLSKRPDPVITETVPERKPRRRRETEPSVPSVADVPSDD